MIDFNDVMKMTESVFIGLPQSELGRYNQFEQWMDLLMTPPQTVKQRRFGLYVPNIQNELARLFLKTECEYFWLINDDELYPSELLIHLLNRKKDVIGPLKLTRNFPFQPMIYGKRNPDGTHDHLYLRRIDRGLKKVGAIGGGATLIHRRVFEAIPDPWWTQTMNKHPLGHSEMTSEDMDFCDKVIAAGFDIYADLDVSVIHMTQVGLRPMVDPKTGEWTTVILRDPMRIAIPTARPVEGPIIEIPPLREVSFK